jgi:formate hydrogenlyase subunit 6/NADH:ubiquinone oxidoreductase subunit I
MLDYFKEVWTGFSAICQGLWITLRYLWKPAITVQYPKEKLVPFERFRGALLFDADTCIACNLCVKACPSACILLENATIPDPKNPELKKKTAKIDWYSIDFGKCNFCRLCEEACPTKPKSVWHSLDYEVLFAKRDEMVRGWQKGFEFIGRYFDLKEKKWKAPKGQIQIQTVQARR